ncbi:MAG: hypothetical protein IJY65_00155 [Clostridia bacterium]|nr:hypothetical protein [Clostridia bacterium]
MSEDINKNGREAGGDSSLHSAISKISEADAYAKLRKAEQNKRFKSSDEELQRRIESTERERAVRERLARERAERELAARKYAEEYRARLKAEGEQPKAAKPEDAPKRVESYEKSPTPEAPRGVRTADILKRAAEYRKRMRELNGVGKSQSSDSQTEEHQRTNNGLKEEPSEKNNEKEPEGDVPKEKEKIILKIEEEKPNDKLLFIPGEEFYGSNAPEINHALAAVIGAYRANLKLEEKRMDAAFEREMELAKDAGDAARFSAVAEARLKYGKESAHRRGVLDEEIARVAKLNPSLEALTLEEEIKYERLLEESKRRKEELRESYERQLKEAFGDKYAPRVTKTRDEEFLEDVSLALKGADSHSDKRAIAEYEKHLEKKFFLQVEKSAASYSDSEKSGKGYDLDAEKEYEKALKNKDYEAHAKQGEFVPIKRGESYYVREYEEAKEKDEAYNLGTYQSYEDSRALAEYESDMSDAPEKDADMKRTRQDILDEEAIRAYDKYNEAKEREAERRRRATGKDLTEDLMPIVEESFHAVADRDTVFSGELITRATLGTYLKKVDATRKATERKIERLLYKKDELSGADLAALLLDVLSERRLMVEMHLECLKTLSSIDRNKRRQRKYATRLSLAITNYNRTVDDFAACSAKKLTKIQESVASDVLEKSASPIIPFVTYTIPAPVLKESAFSRARREARRASGPIAKYVARDMKKLRRQVEKRTDRSKAALSADFEPRKLFERAEREMAQDLEMISLRTSFLKNYYGERLALEKYSFALTKEEHKRDIAALSRELKLVSRERRAALKLERCDNLRYYTVLCTSPSAHKARRQADRAALAEMHKSISEMLLRRHASNEELVKLYSQSTDLFGERINKKANKKALAAAKAAHAAMLPTLEEIREATAFDPHLALTAMNKKIALVAQIAKEEWRAKKLNIRTASHKRRIKQLKDELKKTESTIRSYVRRARANPKRRLIIILSIIAALLLIAAGVAAWQWDNILSLFQGMTAFLPNDTYFSL